MLLVPSRPPILQAAPFTTMPRPDETADIAPGAQVKMVETDEHTGTYYIDYNKCARRSPAGQIAIVAGLLDGKKVKQATGQYLTNKNNGDNGAYGGKVEWDTFDREGTGSSCWTVQAPIQLACQNAAGGPYYNLRSRLASDTTPWLVVDSKNKEGMVSGRMPPAANDKKAPELTDFCWILPGYVGL